MARENPLQVVQRTNPLVLSSGRQCRLSCPSIPGLRNYYVLSMPTRASTTTEEDEFHVLSHRVARSFAQLYFDDTQCYSLMYSAGRTRRRPWPHVHLIIANSQALGALTTAQASTVVETLAAFRPAASDEC